MPFTFDTIDRSDTHAIKHELYRNSPVLPMWVADMDLASPPCVQEALASRAAHPVYGYSHPWPSLNNAVVSWCQQQYQWAIDPSWVVWLPGVVPSFNLVIDAFARGGRVLVQEPNYPPLRKAAELRGATAVKLPVTTAPRAGWDWSVLERELAHPDCHLMILCNPMNPQGLVLSTTELERLAAVCREHRVLLCSDEIHCDLILEPGLSHRPASSLPDIAEHSVTLMAASKTFNVAGLGCSFAVIPNGDLRQQLQRSGQDLMPHPNFMGMLATEAAFSEGYDWHVALLAHLKNNRDRVASVISELSGLHYTPAPATFLAWIESDLAPAEAMNHFTKAGIMPSDGKDFGDPRSVRLNFGTGRETLDQALHQLQTYWRQNRPSSS
ncbi:MalY/PatB family protein [Saccharospirillum impatiens]|uniref:MalY/PatB family protein n=1 Tax=Saccharospirillum impatiens TaxID=169438 RepID=UPI000400BA9F|nr:PatB family C-S lyase [Saccharospirillum impatiens]